MTNVSGWNKGRFDHFTHEQVANPFRILSVGLISFLSFCIFGMSKNHRIICLFQNIKYRDPILAGRFHTNFSTVIFSKPVRQFLQSFRKRRETSLLIISSAVCIGNTDTSIWSYVKKKYKLNITNFLYA